MANPKPATITILYDQNLAKITSKRKETAVVNEGINFLFFLQTIFEAYPEIQDQYPPGTLGLLVNGQPPNDFTTLKNGDVFQLDAFFTPKLPPLD
jgi:hypothetical protein